MQLLTLPPRKLDYRADVEFLAQAQSQMSDREKEALANLVLLHEDVVENFSRTIDSADARLAQWQTAVEGAAAALKETVSTPVTPQFPIFPKHLGAVHRSSITKQSSYFLISIYQ